MKTRQAIYFSHRSRPPEHHVTLNGRTVPFMNHVKYLGVIFDRRITWRLHIVMIEAKAFKTFIRCYCLFKSEWMADTHLLKLQRLQNKFFCTIGNFPRCTPVHDLHTAFNLLYVYNYIMKLCQQQAEVIQNHENDHICSIGQGEARQKTYSIGQHEARHRKCKWRILGGSQAHDRSSD